MPGFASAPPAGYVRCRKCGIDVADTLPSAKSRLCPDCKTPPEEVREIRSAVIDRFDLSTSGLGRVEVVSTAATKIGSPLLRQVGP